MNIDLTGEEKKKKNQNSKVIIIDLTGEERKKKKHSTKVIIDIHEDDDNDIDIDLIGKREDKKISTKVMIIGVDDVQVNNGSPKKITAFRKRINSCRNRNRNRNIHRHSQSHNKNFFR